MNKPILLLPKRVCLFTLNFSLAVMLLVSNSNFAPLVGAPTTFKIQSISVYYYSIRNSLFSNKNTTTFFFILFQRLLMITAGRKRSGFKQPFLRLPVTYLCKESMKMNPIILKAMLKFCTTKKLFKCFFYDDLSSNDSFKYSWITLRCTAKSF